MNQCRFCGQEAIARFAMNQGCLPVLRSGSEAGTRVVDSTVPAVSWLNVFQVCGHKSKQ